jgi:hypothetical protein
MNDIQATLDERGTRYGDFMGHAEITVELKGTIFKYVLARNKVLEVDQQEALDMICHKIGRILNGDPNYADSWHDIAGYAQLVANRLNYDSALTQLSS